MNKKTPKKKPAAKPAALTHTDLIKCRLEAIRPNITTGDRTAACQHFGLSKSTISKMLSGRGFAVETALDVLLFLDARVSARAEQLKQFAV